VSSIFFFIFDSSQCIVTQQSWTLVHHSCFMVRWETDALFLGAKVQQHNKLDCDVDTNDTQIYIQCILHVTFLSNFMHFYKKPNLAFLAVSWEFRIRYSIYHFIHFMLQVCFVVVIVVIIIVSFLLRVTLSNNYYSASQIKHILL
jgi:hypothetical protein